LLGETGIQIVDFILVQGSERQRRSIMNRPIRSILRISLFFILWNSIPLYAQDSPLHDWILSMFRGKWDRISFYDQSTLLFLSDTKVVVDGDPMQYTLIPGGVRISSKDGSVDYPYVLTEDQLTVNFPDGDVRTYRRTESGTSERVLNGKYYISEDSTISGELIAFEGGREFHLYSSPFDSSGKGLSAGVISEDGIYRVEGDMAILAFTDGTTDRAVIRFYDADGFATGVIFHDQLYAKETPVITIVPAPPPVAHAPIIIDYPPPYFPPGPYPYPPGGSTPTTNPPSGGRPSTPIRDFGNTRGDAGKSGDRTSPPTRAPSRDSGNTRADIGKKR
jgi:hypothetical protein